MKNLNAWKQAQVYQINEILLKIFKYRMIHHYQIDIICKGQYLRL